MKVTPEDWQMIKGNLFPDAICAVQPWRSFKWHSDGRGKSDTYLSHSSQALAIDIFGTICCLAQEERDSVVGKIAENLGLSSAGPWHVKLECEIERQLLGERRPTQLDAVAWSEKAFITFECKFRERGGGACSQPKYRAQCSSSYAEQTNPVNNLRNRCALTAKGVMYWSSIPEVLDYPNDIDYAKCPFSGEAYQLMRNVVACHAASKKDGKQGAAVVVYVDNPKTPIAKYVTSTEWNGLVARAARGPICLSAMSYQSIIQLASAAAVDRSRWERLQVWFTAKLAASRATRCRVTAPS